MNTPEVAQNDGKIEILPYNANRDFAFFSAFGHALFNISARDLQRLFCKTCEAPIMQSKTFTFRENCKKQI